MEKSFMQDVEDAYNNDMEKVKDFLGSSFFSDGPLLLSSMPELFATVSARYLRLRKNSEIYNPMKGKPLMDLAETEKILAGISEKLKATNADPSSQILAVKSSQQDTLAASREAAKAIEDQVVVLLQGKNDLWQAIMYQLLNARGMTLSKAHDIKRRAGLTE